jgi:hypothetical protein
MRHILNLLLRIINGRDNGSCNLLEQVGETVFLGRGFAGVRAALGLLRNAAIGIETAQGAVAFLQDATAFFDERLDVVDEFFFVEFVAGSAIGLFDILENGQRIASTRRRLDIPQ